MKKVAIYVRVSSEKQAEEKTIESQVTDLRETCKGNPVVEEYRDDGWSGETLARPALDRLRDDAAKGVFEVVYIHSPDRLARKYAYQVLVLDELKRRNIEVVFLNRPVSSSPEDQLLLGVQGLIAEYEKAKILERTRRGRLHKARQNKVVGHISPYGYRYVRMTSEAHGYYEVDESEAETVLLIFEAYIRTSSVRAVAKELTTKGIRPRKGIHWRTSTLHRILRNESYIGTTYYNKYYAVETENARKYRRVVKSGRKLRDRAEWVPIQVPEIIGEDVFHAAQRLLDSNHRFCEGGYLYLLSGLVRCGGCQSNYTGEKGKGQYYYRCNNRHRRFPLPRTCSARTVRATRLDDSVWHAIRDAIENPCLLESYVERLLSGVKGGTERLEGELALIRHEREELEVKRERLVELYSDGHVEKAELVGKLDGYRKATEHLDARIAKGEEALARVVDMAVGRKLIERFCDAARHRLASFQFEERRQFVRHLVDEITYSSETRRARIVGHVPTGGTLGADVTAAADGIASRASTRYEHNPVLRFEMEVSV